MKHLSKQRPQHHRVTGWMACALPTMLVMMMLGIQACSDKPTTEDNAKTANGEVSAAASDAQTEQGAHKVYRPVQAMQVGSRTVENTHVFTGLVKAGKESILSFRVAGNISRLPVEIGSYVRKGDLIAELDDTDYHVSYSSSMANLKNIEASQQAVRSNIKQAESELIRARAAYARAERLFETNTIPTAEFEQARSAWQAAEASFDASQLQYSAATAQTEAASQQAKSAKNQMLYTLLYAPYSGVISQVNVEENEQVAAGTPIVLLSNNARTEIEVGLPASVINKVRKGDMVSASFFSLPNRTFSGVVSKVGFSTGSSSVYPVVIKLTKPNRDIRPGMTANVTFDFDSRLTQSTQTILPASALGEDNQGMFVYVLTPKGTQADATNASRNNMLYQVERRAVELGDMVDTGFVVTAGVATGELIAKAGLNVIQPNDEVTLYQSPLDRQTSQRVTSPANPSSQAVPQPSAVEAQQTVTVAAGL